MHMNGFPLLDVLRSLPSGAPAAAFLRHAERFPITDIADPAAAEITPAGALSAEEFGRQLSGFDYVRLFHSPVKRCRQTAECLARGAAAAGLGVELVGPEDALGIDYILDFKEAGRLTVEHGEHFVRLWFTEKVSPSVIRAARELADRKLAYVAGRLREPCTRARRLDLHVSHDWNIIVLRELVCGVRHEEAGWLDFLDGIAFTPVANGVRAICGNRAVTANV